MLLVNALSNTDTRLSEGKPVTPGFLIAALLWIPMQALYREHLSNGMEERDAMYFASDVVISRQLANTALPRRFTKMAREIWQFQLRLRKIKGKQPEKIIEHPRFRAAYDFLILRAQSGENVGELAEWWTQYQGEHAELPQHRRKHASSFSGKRKKYRK